MRIGVMFPGDELRRCQVDDVDEWIEAVVDAGFDHVVFGDHVAGVDQAQAPLDWSRGWPGREGASPYTSDSVFREPLTTFGYLAAKCPIELTTGVLVLPQRQTVLVAKQAAEVDLLSRGRLRLGVAVGWNRLEYEALGGSFERRGRILEEQIEVLRLLWTRPIVVYEGEYHRLSGVGIMALPVQRPIPLWLGGTSEAAFDRVARLADGLLLTAATLPTAEFVESLRVMRARAAALGRDPAEIGLEPRLVVGAQTDHESLELMESWRRLTATHICVDTRYAGLSCIGDHILALRRAAELLL